MSESVKEGDIVALGTKVGDIFLDLNINKKGFQTQLGSIGKLATKAGATIAAAFSVKKSLILEKHVLIWDLILQKYRTLWMLRFHT